MSQHYYLIKIEQPSNQSYVSELPSFMTPQLGFMLLLLGGVALLSMDSKKKGKLSTSYWGGNR